VFSEALAASEEWISYPQAQKAALGLLKDWQNMATVTRRNKEQKARAGKRALACLVFTCMNPLRVASWRLMTVHKKLPKDGLRVVVVPGKHEEPGSTLYFRGAGSFKNHKFVGDLQLACGTVLSKALHDFVRVSGDRKRAITNPPDECIPKKPKYLFPNKNGDPMPLSSFTMMISRTFKKATGHSLCPQRC
jgi:hypothetical protein